MPAETKESPTKEAAPKPSSAQEKIADRLTQAVDDAPPSNNRSPDLVPLTAEYEVMRKKLRTLVSLATKYAETTEKMHTSKEKLVDHIALMSEESPIYNEVGAKMGKGPSESVKEIRESPAPAKTVGEIIDQYEETCETNCASLAALQQLASAQAAVNRREYHVHVIDYVTEWEKIVTERVDGQLKKVKKLQADRAHYEKKVELLRQRTNEVEAKGKENPKSQVEKLTRNEEKLNEAFTIHETEAGRLCVLIEEVVEKGWKDLYHLVKNYMKWESNRVGRETDIYSKVEKSLDGMKSSLKKGTKKSKQ